MTQTIAAVIVTYNRKDLLIQCLESIRIQTHKPDAIIIVDNRSTDGTPELLFKENYINQNVADDKGRNQVINHQVASLSNPNEMIHLAYIRKFENDGGAGGFFWGMKFAYEAGYDWLWLMDDDGIAEKEQLNELVKGVKKYSLDYANALVINKENPDLLSFGIGKYQFTSEIDDDEIIRDQANPFNGTFIAKEVISEIGFIKKEMFIWGDESEYLNRVKRNKYKIATIISAKHFHPVNKGTMAKVFPVCNHYKVALKPKKLSHIYFRNLGYLHAEYGKSSTQIYTIFSYSAYFILRLKFAAHFIFLKYYLKGIRNDFR